jgi:hypothetical protein
VAAEEAATLAEEVADLLVVDSPVAIDNKVAEESVAVEVEDKHLAAVVVLEEPSVEEEEDAAEAEEAVVVALL